MAATIDQTIRADSRLLVQAGTGTGKSLGYLAPAAAYLVDHPGSQVVVATATLALQTQLATKDVPTVAAATSQVTGRDLTWCLLKGRSNYACLLRVRDETGVETAQAELLGASGLATVLRAGGTDPVSLLGAEVLALRQWAEDEREADRPGDRDSAPGHSAKAWAQVSVSGRECVGAQSCPYAGECFAEAARDRARRSDLIVTNHALVAVDAERGGGTLPDPDVIVLDEAHELPARVTGAASTELSPQGLDRVARRAAAWLPTATAEALEAAREAFRQALDDAPVGRVTRPTAAVVGACAVVRAALRAVLTDLGQTRGDTERTQAANIVQEVHDAAERMATLDPADVLWVSQREAYGPQLVIAPLSVAELIRHRILSGRVAILTSATLALGGTFTPTALSVGLSPAEEESLAPPDPATAPVASDLSSSAVAGDGPAAPPPSDGPESRSGEATGITRAAPGVDASWAVAGEDPDDGLDDSDTTLPWSCLDVGSPFQYPRQGIAYVARHLPAPGRDGIGDGALFEIGELMEASGGHALGLFSSLRAAQTAAAWVRASRDLPILCQGEGHLADLVARFRDEDRTSLFGTISLWQGVDAPGATCHLVLIDRIPFPRPDEPLIQARQEAVARRGGNGFMEVAAAHAALLLAQGTGRLIRGPEDRGVVAILDSRLATARYGAFLRRSLPPFWFTTDQTTVLGALRRLHAETKAAD